MDKIDTGLRSAAQAERMPSNAESLIDEIGHCAKRIEKKLSPILISSMPCKEQKTPPQSPLINRMRSVLEGLQDLENRIVL